MFLLKSRIRNLNLPIDCQIKLFDQTIIPLLLYGSEIWGPENCSIIEKLHTDFLRSILSVKRSTPLYMLYGELGRFPLMIHIKTRMVNFWLRLMHGNQNKLSYRIYKALLADHICGTYNHKWITFVESIFNETGFSYVWLLQNNHHPKNLNLVISERLKNQYFQVWADTVHHSGKSVCYRMFKNSINLEPYLLILPENMKNTFIKYRTSNHRLPIETGRWENITRSERVCTLCDKNLIGDEYHYVFECDFF